MSSQKRDRVKNEAIQAKLLAKVMADVRKFGGNIDAETVDFARSALVSALAEGTVTDSFLKAVTRACIPSNNASRDAAPMRVADAPASIPEPRKAAAPVESPQPSNQSQSPTIPPELLLNTTKRQRQLLADQLWSAQAAADREAAALKRLQEKSEKVNTFGKQKHSLDKQLDEHAKQAAADREARRKAQDDMTRAIAENREEMRREKEAAMQKAQREKDFREQQARDLERQREEQRTIEHNEQVRQMMMVQAELQRQRDEELAAKEREKREWQNVLKDNAARLEAKHQDKERQRIEDRMFQRQYEEDLDRQERERAAAKARKAARAATFQQMANAVALTHLKKVQNVDAKIEAEYEEQQRKAMEDEELRKLRARQRVQDTQTVLEIQKQQKQAQILQEREDAIRAANALAAQAREAERQEHARKLAARNEAARMKEFLSTQVQLQHFRETRPLETSITRPESRATTMYSPSRYTPSPKLLV